MSSIHDKGRVPRGMKTTAATVVFHQDERNLDLWHGRLFEIGRARDSQSNYEVVDWATIMRIEVMREGQWVRGEEVGGSYNITIQGGSKHSRRYSWAPTFKQAQEEIMAWAGRRFRVPVES